MPKENNLFLTTEGTRIIDLVRMKEGTTGVFLCRFAERNMLQARISGDALRTGGKTVLKSFPVVLDGKDDLWHVIFATVEKQGEKRRGYNTKTQKR